MNPYVLVSGDFVQTGGMDAANYWMARHLADAGHEVHLVSHRIADELAHHPAIRFHRVPRPFRSSLLGEPMLDRTGRHWGGIIARRGGRVLVNGGNCLFRGSNWVHYVHAAYSPTSHGSGARRLKSAVAHRKFLTSERRALLRSKLLIVNSERTRSDVTSNFFVPPDRVRTVYYGTDARVFHPHSADEKARARAQLGLPPASPVILFIGSPLEERKGFSFLLEAWNRLCADRNWDAWLAVAGAGATSDRTHASASARIHFLGFRQDIPQVLAACDLLVSTTRYEAYGLAVQEALCSGVPAFVTEDAGVAERYPPALKHLLIRKSDDAEALCIRLQHWRSRVDEYRAAIADFGQELRSRTWHQSCAEMVEMIEAAG